MPDKKTERVKERARSMGVFKAVGEINKEGDALASTILDHLEPLKKKNDENDERRIRNNANKTQESQKRWKPWQDKYYELVAVGTGKAWARKLIADEIVKSKTWKFGDCPSQTTINKWLK